ncbi:S-layer homology domain-containing protein [Cohnella hashimotonis]|uniref:Ig-like domain-containing protein n=1 Tax=Cohnella hashimotonis TaxID=2826895 RepID=A0ABT6TRN5_9BACL|nr:Ig-like domain-containing protein [Cohnella hashimotonis]MDI4649394.1 Ig-like domain-containing protein [Cohnella hashimotonis]
MSPTKASAASEPLLVPLTNSDYLDFTSNSSANNPSKESGTSGNAVGNVYRYKNVLTKNNVTVDALVKIVSKDTTATLNLLDDDPSGKSADILRRFNPTISTSGGAGGILFQISFVRTGTSDPVYLKGFNLTAIDLDGNNSYQEYAEVGGFSSYEVGNKNSSTTDYRTSLTIYDANSPVSDRPSGGRTRFKGVLKSLQDVSFDNTASFIAHYDAPVQTISVLIGNTGSLNNGTGIGRQFSLNFGAPGGIFDDPATYSNADSPTINVEVQDGTDGKLSVAELPNVVLSGTTTKASTGDIVTITVEDSAGKILTFTTNVVSGGGYTKNVDLSSLAMGAVKVTASVVNANGNPSTPATDTSEITNTAPVATNVEISGDKEVGQQLTGDYHYDDADGNLEGTSTFKWYVGSNADGTGKTLVNGATGSTYTPVAGDVGKYVFFEVTPVATAGVITGSPVVSTGYGPIAPANTAPVATNVAITGDKEAGETLTGGYTYGDADDDTQGTSTFKWYVGTQADGSGKTVVADATSKTYTPVASDVGKYVFFEVTPVATSGVLTGSPVVSTGYGVIKPANTAPVATNVAITGDKEVGKTLTGGYTYGDADDDTQGTSTFKWYVGTQADGSGKTLVADATSKTYTPVASDVGKYVFFEVTPVAMSGVLTGSPVVSTGYGVIKPANTAPVATNVAITGDKEVGKTLTGGYTYGDADDDTQGTSTFKWYVGTQADGSDKTVVTGATSKTYTPVAGDAGKYLFFEVTPVAEDGVLTGLPVVSTGYGVIKPANTAPVATNVAITGDKEVGKTLTGGYTYGDADDDTQGTSTFKWYVGNQADGSGKTVVADATSKTYTPVAGDAGKYLFFEVTPVAEDGVLTGLPVVSTGYGLIKPANTAPVATNVAITGDKEVGKTLTGGYTYGDADDDTQGTSTFKWYVGTQADGSDKTVVTGATSKTYTPVAGDAGKYLFFEVTPVAEDGVLTGLPVVSTGYGVIKPANTAPVATNVAITGDKEVGKTLTGGYTYGDADDDTQGTSTFKWYVGSQADGSGKTVVADATSKTYTPVAGDVGKYLFFEVTPVAEDGVLTGLPVVSTGYGVIKPANTAPVATNVAITGDKEVGKTLTGGYTYGDADDDTQGTSTFKWYVGTQADGSDKTVVTGATSKTYTPVAGDVGKYLFFEVTPVAEDGVIMGLPVVSTGYGPIVSANVAPVAHDGSKSTYPNTAVNGTLSATDADTNDTVTYSLDTDAAQGTVTVNPDGSYTYTPAAGYVGTDTFTFKATDGKAYSNVATVTITITNRKPTAFAQDVVISVNGAVYDGMLQGSDPDSGDTLIFAKESGPSHGNVEVNEDGTYTYKPTPGYGGEDSFTFTVTDNHGAKSAPAKVTIAIAEPGTYVIRLVADPDTLIGDGVSTSQLTATLLDSEAQPVAGVKVKFSAPSGTFPDGDEAVTNIFGQAVIPYKTSKIASTTAQVIPVTAEVYDTVRGIYSKKQLNVTFQPAAIRGVVASTVNGQRVVEKGVTVRITNEAIGFSAETTTDELGQYAIPVPEGDLDYNIEIIKPVTVGGETKQVSFKQTAKVGQITGSGEEYFDSEKVATGIIVLAKPDGSQKLLNDQDSADRDMAAQIKVKIKDPDTGAFVTVNGQDAFALDPSGVFSIPGLVKGKKYGLAIVYSLPDAQGGGAAKEIIMNAIDNDGTLPKFELSADGELNILDELIDPYGDITDKVAGTAVDGAHVVLYYADTPRNRAAGITPGTEVVLPAIVGFAPNDNANPQTSKGGGKYAYMVYPTTDYYLVVTAAGYETYVSPTIPVEFAIVRHDVPLTPQSGSPTPVVPSTPADPEPAGKPDLTVNVAIDRSTYEESSTATVTVKYKNNGNAAAKDAQITLTIPEGAEVLDAAGGTVSNGKIVWKPGTVETAAGGQFLAKLKWPQIDAAERMAEVDAQASAANFTPEGAANAESSAKLLIFSNRYGNVSHIRYILGYPDKKFLPNRTLTRAELAAIIARLIDGGSTTLKAQYSDVREGHWASGYIRIASDNGIFTGYTDGSFHPDSPVTREELAAVMVRYLKLKVAQPLDPKFADAEGRWSSAAIEALFRNALTTGYEDGTFKPGAPIVRQEAVTMINRLLYRGPLGGVAASFPDVPTSSWAFGQVEEATRSHESTRAADGSEIYVKSIDDNVH